MVRPLDLANHICFNHISPLILWDEHVKSVKHTGLVTFGHSLDLFVSNPTLESLLKPDVHRTNMANFCKYIYCHHPLRV